MFLIKPLDSSKMLYGIIMKIKTTIILIILKSFCFGQSTKTLKDSLFQKGDIIKIPIIVYALSKACCGGEQIDSLKPVGEFLTHHKNFVIEIGCHTASYGSAEKNLILSDFRAKCVWDYLLYDYKLDSMKVKYKGYGETQLLIPEKIILKAKTENEKNKLHLINQRTELKVLEIK